MRSKKLLKSIEEIQILEQTRATELMNELRNRNWVNDFRETYIVRGFLMPVYSPDSLSFHTRIGSFGKHILADAYYGQALVLKDETVIRNENAIFWKYMIWGQEVFDFDEKLEPFEKIIRIEGVPSESIWRETNEITTKLGLSGEKGGGVFTNSDQLNFEKMMKVVGDVDQLENDVGGLEEYSIPGVPMWVRTFWEVQNLSSDDDLEVRPAWFHILNYAIYDKPIQRIPVVSFLYSASGKIENIHFTDDRLTQQARSVITEDISKEVLHLHTLAGRESGKKRRRDMVYWLWYNVGHPDTKETLSYGQIAQKENTHVRTIQSGIRRMDDKLKKLDHRLIWELMGVGNSIRLGSNFIYQVLVKKGFAPEGEIDSFSSPEETARKMTGFNPTQK